MISEILAFLGEMHQNWLEKPSVEQNNHSFLKWLGRGIGVEAEDQSGRYARVQRSTCILQNILTQHRIFIHNCPLRT